MANAFRNKFRKCAAAAGFWVQFTHRTADRFAVPTHNYGEESERPSVSLGRWTSSSRIHSTQFPSQDWWWGGGRFRAAQTAHLMSCPRNGCIPAHVHVPHELHGLALVLDALGRPVRVTRHLLNFNQLCHVSNIHTPSTSLARHYATHQTHTHTHSCSGARAQTSEQQPTTTIHTPTQNTHIRTRADSDSAAAAAA